MCIVQCEALSGRARILDEDRGESQAPLPVSDWYYVGILHPGIAKLTC